MLFHIARRSDWDADLDRYTPPEFDDEGFVHCSAPDQVLGVANALFRGRHDLVLLVIDPEALSAPVVWEDCYENGTQFPHVYGPIDVGAVTRVIAFTPDADGSFRLPPALADEP